MAYTVEVTFKLKELGRYEVIDAITLWQSRKARVRVFAQGKKQAISPQEFLLEYGGYEEPDRDIL